MKYIHIVDLRCLQTVPFKTKKLVKKLRNFQRKWTFNILEFCTNVNFFKKTTTALLLEPSRYINGN